MARYPWAIAAASAPINTELLSAQGGATAAARISDRVRGLAGIGLAGGNTAYEYEVEVRVGNVPVGRYRNTRSGATAPNMDDFQPIKKLVPAGAQVSVLVTVAPTVSPTNGFIELEE